MHGPLDAKEKLVIIIAHRLSTIAHADKIVFLKEGKILEQGSHEEPMADPQGAYRQYVMLQGAESSSAATRTKPCRISREGITGSPYLVSPGLSHR